MVTFNRILRVVCSNRRHHHASLASVRKSQQQQQLYTTNHNSHDRSYFIIPLIRKDKNHPDIVPCLYSTRFVPSQSFLSSKLLSSIARCPSYLSRRTFASLDDNKEDGDNDDSRNLNLDKLPKFQEESSSLLVDVAVVPPKTRYHENEDRIKNIKTIIENKDDDAHPIGSLTDSILIDIEESILFWCNSSSSSSIFSSSGDDAKIQTTQNTSQQFHLALEALLRLAEEQDYRNRERTKILATDNNDDEDEYQVLPTSDYQVRNILINRVVDCWRRCWRDHIIDTPNPQGILQIIEKLELQGLQVDCRTLTLIVDGMILRGDPLEAPLLAQWLLDRRVAGQQRIAQLQKQGGRGNERGRVSTSNTTTDEMVTTTDGETGMRPDVVFITTIIRAWARSGRMEAPEMAEALLQLMHEYDQTYGWYECAPNTLSYQECMDAWYRSRRPEACDEMHRLLNEMKTSSVQQVKPDRVSYSYVINCYANNRQDRGKGSQKAYDLLMEMLQLYQEGGNELVAPNTANFSKVMYSLATKGKVDEVLNLFDRLKELYTATGGDLRFKPDENCQKALLVAYTKSGGRNIYEADKLLMDFATQTLQQQHQSQEQQVQMLRRSYFIDVLVAWTKQQLEQKGGGRSSEGSKRAQHVLMTMVQLAQAGYPQLMPDAKSFEKVIYSWSNSRDDKNAPQQVMMLLDTMQQLYDKTRNTKLKPTSRAYEMALTCWSRSAQYYPQKVWKYASEILQEMDRRYYEDGDQSMKPTRGAYTALMLTRLRSRRNKHTTTDIQKIFDTFQQRQQHYFEEIQQHTGTKKTTTTIQRPDAHMYTILMDSWAQEGNMTKVQSLFQEMVHEAKHGNEEAKPDIKAFNILLKAWGASNSKSRTEVAEQLFHSIKNASSAWNVRNSGDVSPGADVLLTPDRQTYNEMIVVWATSKETNAAEKAEYYLRQLKLQDFEPTVLSYRAVIDAWTSLRNNVSDEDEKCAITARATAILDELLDDIKSQKVRVPYYKPYMKFLQTVARSHIPRRNIQAKELLKSIRERDGVPKLLLPPPAT